METPRFNTEITFVGFWRIPQCCLSSRQAMIKSNNYEIVFSWIFIEYLWNIGWFFINFLFCTGRNVPWEVADMDDSMEESSLKALLTNTRAMVSNALALAERFVTWSFREESFSLADVVDTGLWLQCCSCWCCGCSCSCSCGGLVGDGRWVGYTLVVCWKGGGKREG